jgi:Fic family protein
MASAQEKLAAALGDLKDLQAEGARVFQSEQFSRTSRERLLEAGFLQDVIRGWVVSADPTARPGDTTAWFSSFWEFCGRYCESRFGRDWCLTPEQSLLVHAERMAVPRQVTVSSSGANNKRVELAYGTSLFALKGAMPASDDLLVRYGLRMYSREAALVHATVTFFEKNPLDAQVILKGFRDPSGLLVRLLDGGRTTIAGRLAGAFRRIGNAGVADEIISAMRAAGHHVRESDPFDTDVATAAGRRTARSPLVERLHTLWATSRDSVLRELALAPRTTDVPTRLSQIDDLYRLDAYHSLSIEGYDVTPELVERVASGAWDPSHTAADRENRNALAARGYWQAFQAVRASIERLLADGRLEGLRLAHRDWYRQLFAPAVAVGLMKASQLAGYRTAPVFLRGSRHLPPRWEVVRDDAMPALFDLIEAEESAAVRAVLGHWLFGYIHPFPDGNGRVARFLMNALLVHGGYPWTVIRVEDRSQYLACLESASVDADVRPFAAFIAKQVKRARKR